MSGGSGADTLSAGMPGYSLDLGLHATEPAVIEGNKCGYISMASLGSSYYYSWTSLATAGTVTDHGVTLKVTGETWMDHQWGQIAITGGGGGGGGWDWFRRNSSCQLPDVRRHPPRHRRGPADPPARPTAV